MLKENNYEIVMKWYYYILNSFTLTHTHTHTHTYVCIYSTHTNTHKSIVVSFSRERLSLSATNYTNIQVYTTEREIYIQYVTI